VSLLITELGADPRTVQRFAGHASVNLTLQQYAHLFAYGGQELAEGMERLREQHRNSQ
jgi:integrase